MQYDPNLHHRRSMRLQGYDYSSAGLYFITICLKDMKCRFGKIEKNEMVLNELGLIAHNEWTKLPQRFPLDLDVFQIMPNHMHGIISLNEPAGFTPVHYGIDNNVSRAGVNPAPTVSDVIGAYKSLVSNECLNIYKSNNERMGKFWHRNYYDHIIRNESAYKTISEYIITNPQQWEKDRFYNP